MDDSKVALEVAGVLRKELGSKYASLQKRTSEALQGAPPPEVKSTRELLSQAAEIAVIAHFIVTVVPMVAARWTRGAKPEAAKAAMRESAPRPEGLKPEVRDRAIDAAVDEVAKNQ